MSQLSYKMAASVIIAHNASLTGVIESRTLPITLIKPFNATNNFPISDTNFIIVQAAKKPSIAYVIVLTSSLFSLIQSENFFKTSVSNFRALIIISPVHSPIGCKKLFHNHSPTGSKASITAQGYQVPLL